MPQPRRRIELLKRLSRLREVEKQRAALHAAKARGAHSKLVALQERSSGIAQNLIGRNDAASGAELAGQLLFASGLEDVRQQTAGEARKAEGFAKEAIAKWKVAEHRHDLTGDRLTSERRSAEKEKQTRETPLLARKLKGSP